MLCVLSWLFNLVLPCTTSIIVRSFLIKKVSFYERVDWETDVTQGCTACKWKGINPTLSDSLPFKFGTIQSYFPQLPVFWDSDTHNMLGLRCTYVQMLLFVPQSIARSIGSIDMFFSLFLNRWFLVLVDFKSFSGTLMTVWHLGEMQVYSLLVNASMITL